MNILQNVNIQSCEDNTYFEHVIQGIQHMKLDAQELKPTEFLIALLNHQTLLGFGRLREYPSAFEICSVGVFEPFRNKGIGKKIIQALLEKKFTSTQVEQSEKDIYIVTIIPNYFAKIGFHITPNFPSEIAKKWHYCTTQLQVQEPYVVMKFNR